MNMPTEEIKKIYADYEIKNRELLIDLVSAAYKEGYNNCINEMKELNKIANKMKIMKI
jgi:DNA-binding protein YbaB